MENVSDDLEAVIRKQLASNPTPKRKAYLLFVLTLLVGE